MLDWGSDRTSSEVTSRLTNEFESDDERVVKGLNLLPESRSRSHVHVARSIYELKGVVFEPRSGVPFIEGRPISESHAVPIEQLLDLAPVRLRAHEKLSGPATGLAGTSYYHWLLEQLPAALRAREVCKSLSVIRWTRSPAFVTAACEVLFERSLVVKQPVFVGDYWLAGQGPDSGVPHPRDLDVLRAATKEHRQSPSGIRLFVPRAEYSRAPDGENELAKELATKHGFRIFDAGEISWLEQIIIFSQADVVVGVHGGALANLAFCSQGTRVLEIMPLTRIVTCFASLSQTLGLKYQSFFLRPEPPSEYGNLHSVKEEVIRAL